MAHLSDSDYRILLGEDFKRKLNSVSVVSENASAEENMAARRKRSQQLTDIRFSCAALAFTGAALVFGALYTGAGLTSVQGEFGIGAIVIGVVGMVVATMKRKTVDAELAASRV